MELSKIVFNARDLAKKTNASNLKGRLEVRIWSVCASGPRKSEQSSGMFQTREVSAKPSVFFLNQGAGVTD